MSSREEKRAPRAQKRVCEPPCGECAAGAALRFSQAPTVARRENRRSAREPEGQVFLPAAFLAARAARALAAFAFLAALAALILAASGWGASVVPAKDAPVLGVEPGVPLAAAAPGAGLGVQKLLRPRGEGQVQGVPGMGLVLGVHDAEQALAPAPAQPGVDPFGAALAGHPLEAAGVVFAHVEGRLAGVQPGQLGEKPLETVVEGVFQQVPVQLLFLVPLPEMGQLVAHKVQLFARMGEHIKVQGAQLAALFLVGAPELVDDGLFAVDHLVVAQGQQIQLPQRGWRNSPGYRASSPYPTCSQSRCRRTGWGR